eukprot:415829_1
MDNDIDSQLIESQQQLIALKMEKLAIVERETELRKDLEHTRKVNKRAAQKREELEGQNEAMRQNIQLFMSETDNLRAEIEKLKKKLNDSTSGQSTKDQLDNPSANDKPHVTNEVSSTTDDSRLQADFDRVIAKLSESQVENSQLRAELESQKQVCLKLQREQTEFRVQSESTVKLERQLTDTNRARARVSTSLEQSQRAQTQMSVAMAQKDAMIRSQANEAAKAHQFKELASKLSADIVSRDSQLAAKATEIGKLKDALDEARSSFVKASDSLRAQEEQTLENEAVAQALRDSSDAKRIQVEAELQENRAENEKINAELEAKIETLEESVRSSAVRLSEAESTAKEARQSSECARDELAKERAKCAEARVELDRKIEEVREDHERKLREKTMESSITARKRNTIVKELKIQLKRETLRCKRLEAEVMSQGDELATKFRESSTPQISPLPSDILSQTSSAPISRRSSPQSSPARSMIDSFDSGFTEHSRAKSVAAGIDASTVAKEVNTHLANLLEEKQNSIFNLQQRIKYLEGTVQELTTELEKKRQVLQNVLRRIEAGVFTTSDFNSPKKRSSLSLRPGPLREEIFRKMEVALDETTLQNEALRVAKDKLGEEVQRLYRENHELNAELSTRPLADAAVREFELPDDSCSDCKGLP